MIGKLQHPIPEQIQESINKSRAKYQREREKIERRKKRIIDGNKFILEFDVKVYRICYLGEDIAIGFLRGTDGDIHYAIAFRSPKDTWSNKIAKGLVGWRLKEGLGETLLYDFDYPAQIIFNILQEISPYNCPSRLDRKVASLWWKLENNKPASLNIHIIGKIK